MQPGQTDGQRQRVDARIVGHKADQHRQRGGAGRGDRRRGEHAGAGQTSEGGDDGGGADREPGVAGRHEQAAGRNLAAHGLGLVLLGADPLVPAVIGTAIGGVVGTFLISEAFVRVTWPMSLPGVFAGSLLTFIPAVGDFINAELLGNPRTQMIGNVIQGRFLEIADYPMASALSFILMAAIIVGVLLYARVIGTEELTGGRA